MPKNNILPKGVLFTTIPDHFLAHVMSDLSASQLRVMLYIYLHTLGYGKLADAISYDQFVNGIVTRDGRRLDCGAGVSRRSLVGALTALEKRGLITRRHNGYSATTIQLEITSPDEDNFSSSNAAAKCQEVSGSSNSIHLEPEPEPGQKQGEVGSSLTHTAYDTHQLSNAGQLTTVKTVPPVDLDEVQVLRPSLEDEVQVLPSKTPDGVQNLHPTQELTGFKHEDINRGYNPLAVELSAMGVIVDKIKDISQPEALRLVKIAFNLYGRDEAYISRLVDYIALNPAIHKPAAVLTTLIKQDQDRTVAVSSPHHKKSDGQRRIASRLQTVSDTKSSYSQDHPDFGDSYRALTCLLVQKQLLSSLPKAQHYVQIARGQHISPSELHTMVWEAMQAAPGQRSASFEASFNSALATSTSVNKARFTAGPKNGFDFSKYTGNGKYANLTTLSACV